MRYKIYLLIFFVLFSISQVYSKTVENIVSTVCVNNFKFFDIELLVEENNNLLIPFKSFSEIFGIDYKVNHKNHNIEFTYDSKTGVISKNYIKINNKIISQRKNIYLKTGLMDETKDEIFCSSEDLEKIFDSKIDIDKNDLSISLETQTIPKILEVKDEISETSNVNKIRTYKNVLSPEKSKNITFDNLTVNNNTLSDAITQYNINQNQTSKMLFNNNSQLALFGKAFNGEYKVDFNTYSYKDEPLVFGGFGINYKNRYKNYEYELGKPSGIMEKDHSLASQMFGFQLRNYSTKEEDYKEINGTVNKDNFVKVYLDDDKQGEIISTYDGYYSLNELKTTKNPKKIKITEVDKDDFEEIILEKELKDNKEMTKGEKRYDFLAGVSGYNNRIFNQNNYIYKLNTKKFVLGGRMQNQLEDNLRLDSKIFLDEIYSKPQNSFWEHIYNKDALLTSGTYKNPNNIDGITQTNTLYFNKDNILSHKLMFGFSNSNDINKKNLLGYNFMFGSTYKTDNFKLESEIFNISPNFYMAGSDGGYINDRLGGSLLFNTTKRGFYINSQYKRYFSNLKKEFLGGFIAFDEYNLGISKNSRKYVNFRFNLNGRQGQNDFAQNKSYYYDLSFSKQLTSRFYFDIGKRQSNYETTYQNNFNNSNNFLSTYSVNYLNLDYKLPKNFGSIKLGHDISNYSYNNVENKYRMAKIAYTFPEFKRFTLTLGTGYKYYGSDNGFDLSMNLAYRTKTGRSINLNYQYNRTGGFIINNMFMPMNDRHSINLVFNDVFAFLPHSIKSVGYLDDNRGYAEIIAYIDKNKNKKFDKGDLRVKNVPIKCSWIDYDIYTNNRGRVLPIGVSSGIYNVEIDTDKLSTTLFQEKSEQIKKMVRIEAKKTTKIEFPLKSCVGALSGILEIQDEFNRNMNIDDFVVVLLDENKKEVDYSTVDSDGNYYFSGIEPGEYILKLDENIKEENNLSDIESSSEIKVKIPYQYKKFIEIKDLKLKYSILTL